jgi:hypothetical protein
VKASVGSRQLSCRRRPRSSSDREVADRVAVEVHLIGVRHQLAVVDRVDHEVAVDVRVARVADAVRVEVPLVVVRDREAVVVRAADVAVIVVVARVAPRPRI